jgi:hypothetical protein
LIAPCCAEEERAWRREREGLMNANQEFVDEVISQIFILRLGIFTLDLISLVLFIPEL